jgi:hypothetical protein
VRRLREGESVLDVGSLDDWDDERHGRPGEPSDDTVAEVAT